MVQGFIGNASQTYLSAVLNALTAAAGVHKSNAFGVSIRNEKPPVSPDEARGGSFSTGIGNISNIVADEHICSGISQKTTMATDKIGNAVYNMVRTLGELCDTSYILPQTVSRCLPLLGGMTNELEPYRALTDESSATICRFAGTITGGVKGTNIDFAWNTASAEETRRRSADSMQTQISNMEDTIQAHERRIIQLEEEAARQDHIAATAMKTEWYTSSSGKRRSRRVPDDARRAAAAAKAVQIRQEIAALRQAIINIRGGIGDLQREVISTNNLFYRLQGETHDTDRHYNDQVNQLKGASVEFTKRLRTIYDSFDTSPV